MKKEIMPKLEKEMEDLRKRMDAIQKAQTQKGKDVQT